MAFLGKDNSRNTWLVKMLALAAISGTAFFYISDVTVSDVLAMVV
jgi:hypothetical protein